MRAHVDNAEGIDRPAHSFPVRDFGRPTARTERVFRIRDVLIEGRN